VLEGESEQTLNTTYRMFHERALPDLGDNIKCGNSLIGPDFYEGLQLSLLDDEERYRINVFDWKKEFKEIMDGGGFDAAIGNPPYIRMEEFKRIKSYLRRYKAHSDRADIFYYFVEKAVLLLRDLGMLGLILSNTFTRSRAGQTLRLFLAEAINLSSIIEFGDFMPFATATVYPVILVGVKSSSKAKFVRFILQDQDPTLMPPGARFVEAFPLSQDRLSSGPWIFEDQQITDLRLRLLSEHSPLVKLFGPVRMGIKTGLNEAFVIDADTRTNLCGNGGQASEIIHPYLAGEDLERWAYRWNRKWLIYTPHGINVSKYPTVAKHLEQYRPALTRRATKQKWYELQQPQEAYARMLEAPKILFPDISRYPKFSLDARGMFFSNTVYFIATDSAYLLGLLNSKLMWFIVRGLSNALRGGLWRFRLFSGHIEKLPICSVGLAQPSKKAHGDQVICLAENATAARQRLLSTKTDHEITAAQRRIDTIERDLDRIVYELCDLTQKEIAIIEGSAQAATASA